MSTETIEATIENTTDDQSIPPTPPAESVPSVPVLADQPAPTNPDTNVKTDDVKNEVDPLVIWAKHPTERNAYDGIGKSNNLFEVRLERAQDRYTIKINSVLVKPDESMGVEQPGTKGSINERVNGDARGWYYIKDIKGFAETYEQKHPLSTTSSSIPAPVKPKNQNKK